MVQIIILDWETCYKSAVYGMLEMLEYVNRIQPESFNIELRSPSSISRISSETDWIIIPPFKLTSVDFKLDRPLIEDLRDASKRGIGLISVCAGAFYLCSTGLVEGKEVTTHWKLTERLQSEFPLSTIRKEKILIDGGYYMSAAGLTSFQDLILYVIKKYCGVNAARDTARFFLIEPDHKTQLQYKMMNLQLSDEDEILRKARDYMENHYPENIQLSEISEACGITVRTLLRRFKSGSDCTPGEYLRELRIEKSRSLLEKTQLPIKEIAFACGYMDIVSYNRCFKKLTGLPPGEYRSRHKL